MFACRRFCICLEKLLLHDLKFYRRQNKGRKGAKCSVVREQSLTPPHRHKSSKRQPCATDWAWKLAAGAFVHERALLQGSQASSPHLTPIQRNLLIENA